MDSLALYCKKHPGIRVRHDLKTMVSPAKCSSITEGSESLEVETKGWNIVFIILVQGGGIRSKDRVLYTGADCFAAPITITFSTFEYGYCGVENGLIITDMFFILVFILANQRIANRLSILLQQFGYILRFLRLLVFHLVLFPWITLAR